MAIHRRRYRPFALSPRWPALDFRRGPGHHRVPGASGPKCSKASELVLVTEMAASCRNHRS